MSVLITHVKECQIINYEFIKKKLKLKANYELQCIFFEKINTLVNNFALQNKKLGWVKILECLKIAFTIRIKSKTFSFCYIKSNVAILTGISL